MTPQNPKDPNLKKPTPAQQSGKPTVKLPAKPGEPKPAPKPAASKADDAKAAEEKNEKKPLKKEKSWPADTGSRKIGQIMVDLGFLDEGQLWDILEEARTNSMRVGQVAVTRGLVTEDQLLQAIAEQHGLRVVNLEDEKPSPQAIQMVQQPMAEV